MNHYLVLEQCSAAPKRDARRRGLQDGFVLLRGRHRGPGDQLESRVLRRPRALHRRSEAGREAGADQSVRQRHDRRSQDGDSRTRESTERRTGLNATLIRGKRTLHFSGGRAPHRHYHDRRPSGRDESCGLDQNAARTEAAQHRLLGARLG